VSTNSDTGWYNIDYIRQINLAETVQRRNTASPFTTEQQRILFEQLFPLKEKKIKTKRKKLNHEL
jgi:hypothetical protein